MSERFRNDTKHIFDCFLEIVKPGTGNGEESWILQTYPQSYKDREAQQLKTVPKFVFPCELEITTVQNFSFVLTKEDAKWTFGFCRVSPDAETALVMLSSLPWHEAFYKLLNHIAEVIHHQDAAQLGLFLDACYEARIPDPGTIFHVSFGNGNFQRDFTCQTPHHLNLPSIPENRNLTEYYNAVGIHSMLVIFASMLYERRIIIVSKKLSRLSACVQAANAIIYPMHWQHIFIPVLPKQFVDYLSAPMPFLIGVPSPIFERVRKNEIGEVVILNADENVIHTPFMDVESLPVDVSSNLKRSLKSPKGLLGDSVARAFLQALVHLIGGYRDALKFRQGEKIIFSEEAFIQSRSSALQPFLQQMLQLQIFRQFIQERLELLNNGKGFSDEFEIEAVRFSEKATHNSKLKAQYSQISSTVKKEGGAIVRSVKHKANPAMKSAVKSVRGLLKYDRFGPSSANAIENDRSPEMEGPAPLDLDLMTDLKDVIYQKPINVSGNQEQAPSINNRQDEKERKPSIGDLINLSISSSPDDEIFDPLASSKNSTTTSSSNPFKQNTLSNNQFNPFENAITGSGMEQAKPVTTTNHNGKYNYVSPYGNSGPRFEAFLSSMTSQQQPYQNIPPPRPPKPNFVPLPPTMMSRSSDDLLQEYGIDFSKLETTNKSTAEEDKFAIFADLDPLAKSTLIRSSTEASAPPMAPPRTSINSKKQNWTTFQ